MNKITIHLNNLKLGRIGNATAALQVLKDLWGDGEVEVSVVAASSEHSQIEKAKQLCKDLGLVYTLETTRPHSQ